VEGFVKYRVCIIKSIFKINFNRNYYSKLEGLPLSCFFGYILAIEIQIKINIF
jgi:hypothetical protein